MERELATHHEDLPHEFETTRRRRVCALCDRERAHDLHTLAAREVAALHSTRQLQREIGS